MERTYEYRLYPTPAQRKGFLAIEDTVRALYNRMLIDRTNHYRQTGSWKKLNPEPFVKESLLMRDLDPSIINWTLARLQKAYLQFFYITKTQIDRYQLKSLKKAEQDPDYKLMETDLIGYPRIKKKSSRGSWSIAPSQVLITPNRAFIPGMGSVKLRLHRPIPQKAKLQYYTILKKPSNHYYLLVHLQLPEPETKTHLENAIGIALVPGKLAQCSDARAVQFRHQTQAQEEQIRRAYEKLCRKTPGSRQYEKQRIRLASLYEHRTYQRKDSLHKISREIINKADFIAVEEPMVHQKKKRLLQEGAFQTVTDEAWWMFSEYLKYKSQEKGKRFWRASGAIPVRNACSVCGVISEKAQKDNMWNCPICGVKIPADLNAARNLERFGTQYIQEFKDLNRQT